MDMHNSNAHGMHHTDPAKQSEHAAVFNLVKPEEATHIAVKSGSWFDAATWKNGKIPSNQASVYIPENLVVDYDSTSDIRLFTLRVDGQLDFATDTDTKMIVDTFVVSTTGTLTIGTEENPVQGNVETKILIADNGAIDKTWDPQQLSRGIVSHGTVEIHGQEKTSHLKVSVDPSAGDKTLTLDNTPTNWNVGDRIVLTGTHYLKEGTEDEERIITAINGNKISLDRALSFNHDTPRNDLKAYVANQSRNIIVATENADALPANQRGHVMFMHSDNVDVRYAEFHELGRTDKSKLLDDFVLNGDGHRIKDGQGNPIVGARTNIRGRYALHLHRTGVNGDESPAILKGNSVVGSPGWGIVQHDSYAVLENNLTYDVFGSGFVSETGNEIGAWRNNISIKNQGRRDEEKTGAHNFDLGSAGHGFWFQSRLVENEGNVAAGNKTAGFFYFHRGIDQIDVDSDNLAIEGWAKGKDTVETSDPPISGFKDNEVFASGNGLTVIKNSQRQFHDGRTILDGFKAWDVVKGTELQYTAHYTLKDFDLLGTKTPLFYEFDPHEGLRLFHNVEDMVFDNLRVEGFTRGVEMDKEIRVGTPLNKWGYIFVDADVKNNTNDWVNLDRNDDRFISRSDIQPGQLKFELDAGKSDLVAQVGERDDNRNSITIAGTKTDSLGAIDVPFGNEDLGYRPYRLRELVQKNGYYTLPDGRQGVVIDEYISDRLTGDLRKYSFLAIVEDTSWTSNGRAPYLGTLDSPTLQQDGTIIPFESLAFDHPQIGDDITPEPTPQPPSQPPSPVGNPPVGNPPAGDPPVDKPFTGDDQGIIRVEAERYDINDFGESDSSNNGGLGDGVRRNLGVDVETSSAGGLNVGWINQGEYLTYDIEVAETGDYRLMASVASAIEADHSLRVSIEGQASTVSFDGTGGWQTWTATQGNEVLKLSAGTHTVRVDMLSSGFNLDYFELMPVAPAADPDPVEPPVVEPPVVDDPMPDTPGAEPPASAGSIRVEAELYNVNDFGESDNSNNGGLGDGSRRNLGVDVETSSAGGLNVGWINQGEYLTYDIEVAETGDYRLMASVASAIEADHSLQVSIEGQASTVNFDGTGGWQTWTATQGNEVLTLSAGTHTVRVDMLSSGFNLDYFELMPVAPAANPDPVEPPVVEPPVVDAPMPDTPGAEPPASAGSIRVEAELYNVNDFGESDSSNNGGLGDGSRRNLGVDVETSSAGGLNVGWINQGEYLTYDIEVAETGDYRLMASVASAIEADHSLRVSIEGQASTVNFDGTGGWQTWTATQGNEVLKLSAGTHTVRVDMLSSGFNLDYFELMPVVSGGNTPGSGPAPTVPDGSLREGAPNLTPITEADAPGIKVSHIHTVNDNVVALRIETGEVLRGKQVDYVADAKDTIRGDGWVLRDNQFVGRLVDGEPGKILLVDQYVGDKLNLQWADTLGNYRIVASDGSTINPTNVYRKSKIDDMAQTGSWNFEWPMEHVVYLELPEELTTGETYRFDFSGDVLQDTEFVYQPEETRSDAVHVSHLGFDPGDTAKVAFLSTWMGNGGGLNYAEGKTFWLVDTATGEKVYQGQTTLSKAADQPDDLRGRNHSDTDVFMLDFSDFSTPGQYSVYVDGVGTSYEFEIGENTWRDAFYVSARGMFHQRSGIELEQPYTDYERPRPFHPDDGVVVYQSTVPLMDTSMGMNFEGNKREVFEALTSTRTEEVVQDAWGGWMDAGDWDRRIQHLDVTRSFLELAELYPSYFQNVDLNLPESNNNLPDIIDEALWGLDVFRRLQKPDGGIPGGIESAEHPKFEGSWQESLTVMAYAPGIWSSYFYAGVAAQAASVLQSYDSGLANVYRESALRAMDWANEELAKNPNGRYSEIYDQRNLAAVELYRLTGDQKWHDLFLETTVYTDPGAQTEQWLQYNQNHAAYVYGRMDASMVDATVQQNAVNALVKQADTEIENIQRTGFKWNANPWAPVGWGEIGNVRSQNLFRAHTLTGGEQYLEAGTLASQFSAGANPDNMMYTTGMGYRSPDRPLLADARATGQAPPAGITVYGPMDLQNPNGYAKDWQWAIDMFAGETGPDVTRWPTAEAYFDSYYYVPVTEFTVHQSIGTTAYTWGYLAAQDGDDDAIATVQGNTASNTLAGTQANDIIIGTQPLDMTPGQEEIDRLAGKAGADTFVLGDIGHVFYDDGYILQPGLKDYALITDFTLAQGDRIQLHGTADEYILGSVPNGLPSGTAIFHTQNAVSELIAVVEDTSVSELEGAFKFVA